MYRYEIIVFRLSFFCHTGVKAVENKACGCRRWQTKRSGSVVLAATPLLKKEGIKTESRLFNMPLLYGCDCVGLIKAK